MSRPIWQGSISFGMVNIPVRLQTAVEEKTVQFHMLSKNGSCRLRRKLYCPETGEEFDYDQTARGVEVGKGEYVMVDDKELEKMKPEKGRTIQIEQFVKLDEIDPIYFDRAYFVVPAEGSEKGYGLLREAMSRSGRVGVAVFVMRGRQYVAALRVLEAGLVLHVMHYADEVLSVGSAVPAGAAESKPPAKEVQVAAQLVTAMTRPLDLRRFKDDYREQVRKLVERKRSGRKTVETADDHGEEAIPPTINLMEALKRSLDQRKPGKAGHHRQSKSA